MDEREITEQDIEVALRYLKYHDPENATREEATSLLEDLQQGYHQMSHDNPELLEKLKKELDENKKSGSSEA